jgi:hypothetical protein
MSKRLIMVFRPVVLNLFCPMHPFHHMSECHSSLSKIVWLKRFIQNNMHTIKKIFYFYHISTYTFTGINIGDIRSFTTATMTMETEDISETSVFSSALTRLIAQENFSSACYLLSRWILAWFILRSWRFKRHFPPKCRLTFNGLYDVISQKTELFITTAVRNSRPTLSTFILGERFKFYIIYSSPIVISSDSI